MSKRIRIQSITPNTEKPESKHDAVQHWITQAQWPITPVNFQHAEARKQPSPNSPIDLEHCPVHPSYTDPRFNKRLEQYNSYMTASPLSLTKETRHLCDQLTQQPQDIFKHVLFCDRTFEQLCTRIQHRNQAMVLQHITPHLVPSAEQYMVEFATQQSLVEAWDEPWTNSRPLLDQPPRPNYAVGFQGSAFTPDQHARIKPLVGNVFANDRSFCMATYLLYFPFLTCQVKSSADCLDAADRENAYSMTIAIRGIVELFRLVHLEDEIEGHILGFSVSHDHRNVRIYGHYVEFEGDVPSYYRYPIRTFDFTEQDGRERWTSFKIVRNIYDNWVPVHLKRLRRVIDRIPMKMNQADSGGEPRSPHSLHSAQPNKTHAKPDDGRIEDIENVHLTPANSVDGHLGTKRPLVETVSDSS